MSIRTQRRLENVLKEQTDINRQADRLLADLQALIGRSANMTAFYYKSVLDGTGEVDAQELAQYESKLATLNGAFQALGPAVTAQTAIKGATDAETQANLDAFVAANGLNIAAYSADFD